MDGVTHVVHPAALCALVAEKLTVKSVSHLYQVCRPQGLYSAQLPDPGSTCPSLLSCPLTAHHCQPRCSACHLKSTVLWQAARHLFCKLAEHGASKVATAQWQDMTLGSDRITFKIKFISWVAQAWAGQGPLGASASPQIENRAVIFLGLF